MITVCATRSVLYAGMLHTVMPLSFAALRSILLYPVPASTMSFTVSGNCLLYTSAGVYVNALNIIHYMHDKYAYEKLEMALHDRKVTRWFATGIAGLSVVADSLSAIKYAKVKPIRDENGIAVDFEIEGDFPKYGNDDDRVDSLAAKVVSTFMNKIRKHPTYRQSVPTMSLLTITSNVVYGLSLIHIYTTPLLEFRNVTFRYDNAESPALENISFKVYHGETLAIMGDIGSGKSTITNLIPRLFSIESGDILFKGKSIYEWNVDDLRAHIGYVPQKAYLFTGTIDMNVRYGAASGQVLSVEDVENACHLAKADEFINRLEGGYQYMVSQGGTNLSGGQRQRLAMARALVRKPDLFIFDDSFSALDGTTCLLYTSRCV